MVAITKMNNEALKKIGVNSLEDFKKYFGEETNNIYYSEKDYFKFFYLDFNDYVYLPLPATDLDTLKQYNIYESILFEKEKINNIIKKKEFEDLFFMIDKQFLFKAYEDLFNKIPDNIKFPCFRIVYMRSEYGFAELNSDFIKKVFSYQNDKEFLKELDFDGDDYLTVYRGEGSQSNTVDNAFSWSIDEESALFFANRFGEDNARLYTAKIHKDNIIDYITQRNEEEILLLPEHLEDIEELEI
ncbi:hypothetical protein [Brassicibacter mesophilus]|uniref:hypothetical protein n=1 Tax=Brassicibacter mesophilus TaxID=745119 RepID=UPI003D22F4F1